MPKKHSLETETGTQIPYDLEDVAGRRAVLLGARVRQRLQERNISTVFREDLCVEAVHDAVAQLHRLIQFNEKSKPVFLTAAQYSALEEEIVTMACDILTGDLLVTHGATLTEPTEDIPDELPVDTNANIKLAIAVIHLAIVSEIAAECPAVEESAIEKTVLAELPKHIQENGMDCDYLLAWEAHRDAIKEKAMRVLAEKHKQVVLPVKTVRFNAPKFDDVPEGRTHVGLAVRKLRRFLTLRMNEGKTLWENEVEKFMFTQKFDECNLNVSLAPKLEEDMTVFYLCWQHEQAKAHASEIQAMVPLEITNDFLSTLSPEERLWLHASAYRDRWESQRDECERMCTSDNQSHQLLGAQAKMHALEDGYEAYMERQKEREIFAQLRGQPPANGARIRL